MGFGARIASIAMALPERVVTNEQIAAGLGVDAAWISKRTGTRERPWANGCERLSELAAAAGWSALERAGIGARELDLVLVATSTADEITPSAGPLVAGLIGADRAGALDVGAACTGRAHRAAGRSLRITSDPVAPRRPHSHGRDTSRSGRRWPRCRM
jgi:3-oxoacyl-[acyl-carrier-protein] synthase-3